MHPEDGPTFYLLAEQHCHVWRFTGVRYRDGSYPISLEDGPVKAGRPRRAVCRRYYCNHYVCTTCGDVDIARLPDDLNNWTDEPIKYDASRAWKVDFPIEDEPGAPEAAVPKGRLTIDRAILDGWRKR